jgi:4-amino-4-deoxy-L-arabinose transferase-like glycosyltransferase
VTSLPTAAASGGTGSVARARPLGGVLAFAVLAVLLRLPFLDSLAGRDEAGYLMVGAGWGHGDDLYGRYWVDRPPLLVWIFEAAGDLTTLRLLGCAAAAAVVLLVGAAAHVAAGPRAALWAAGAAALLTAQPWLGTERVNGEILAAPCSALAVLATVLLVRRDGRWWLAALAGAAATAAVLTKQSTVDGAVFVVVALALVAGRGRRPVRELVLVAAGVVAGVLLTLGVVLALAAARGTGPAELFDAVVWFRVEAGETIRTSASDATRGRLLVLVGTWLVSGLSVLTVGALATAARRRDPVVRATATALVAATVVALLGGSYWAHYLLALVPTAALAAGLAAAAVPERWRWAGGAVLVLVTLVTLGHGLLAGSDDGREARAVGTAIGRGSEAGDTAVVTYGQPNVLLHAGLESPYPYLWSLPVRALDPGLDELAATLDGPDAPTWLVDWSGFDDWGVDGDRLVDVVERRYRPVGRVCGRDVWLDRRVERPRPEPGACR